MPNMAILCKAKDALHELRICWHKSRMLAAESARRRHHNAFVALLKSRSPGQVARMERDRGLA